MRACLRNSCAMSSPKSNSRAPRYLAAFDFDHTIVNDNTDTVVASLIERSKIPERVLALAKTEGCWTAFMQAVFRLLHDMDIKPARIKKTVVEINENPGMVKCLKTLKANEFDLIVISDSNSEFIRDWNDAHDLAEDIRQVFTNPAHFDENGLLIVRQFERQTDCKMSAVNMCKGKILTNFIAGRRDVDKIVYDRVFYVGDGTNDICPALRLSGDDYACMRKDFSMDKKVNEVAAANNLVLRANTIRWSSGVDLLGEILRIIKK